MGNALDSLLAGFGKKYESRHTRDCAAIGCQARVFGYALFCPDCWAKCPSDLKRLIGKHHKPGRAPSKVLMKWLQQTIDELLFLRTNGRYRPVAQTFMWDDDPPPAVDGQEPLFERPDGTPEQ